MIHQDDLEIREEREEDFDFIHHLLEVDFPAEGVFDLVGDLRNSPHYIPELSLVAEFEGKIAGYIMYTKMRLELNDKSTEILCLAPLAVSPEYQNMMVGTVLSEYSLNLAQYLGHKIVHVVGHPNYYPRFGFKRALEFDLKFPIPMDIPDAFMIMELIPKTLKDWIGGKVIYPHEFLKHV